MAKLNFGGVEENVVTRDEFPLSKAQEVLKDEVVAVIGYGVQGPGQALNQKENGIHVIIGQGKIPGVGTRPLLMDLFRVNLFSKLRKHSNVEQSSAIF